MRKPTFSLAYTHDVFGPLTAQAFAPRAGIPDRMLAILDQLDEAGRRDRTLADRLEAIRALTDGEIRNAKSPLRAEL